jgi:tRNA nucleotidyltransferase (CCA-adding enzyme)
MKASLLTEQEFAETIAANGGRVYRVGGCVRDKLMGITPKDIDFCIVGMVRKNFINLFPNAEECGKSFPVFRLSVDGTKCEIAFARTERKVGCGHKGFKVASNPKITIIDDLFRRDTTVNSIAVDCLTGEIIDPFNGIQDIHSGILKATSHHFSDDPLRALRLAGQAARLGFKIEPNTVALASAVAGELIDEPTERILIELTKVLAQAPAPAIFFKVLAQANLLQSTFSEIANLSTQDYEIAMAKLDAVAKVTRQSKLRFAALGLVMDSDRLSCWNSKMTLPGDWLNSAVAVSKITTLLKIPSPENIVEAINGLRRGALSTAEFDLVAKEAGLHIPALSPFKASMALLQDNIAPDTVKGKAIGEWLRQKHIQAIAKLL